MESPTQICTSAPECTSHAPCVGSSRAKKTAETLRMPLMLYLLTYTYIFFRRNKQIPTWVEISVATGGTAACALAIGYLMQCGSAQQNGYGTYCVDSTHAAGRSTLEGVVLTLLQNLTHLTVESASTCVSFLSRSNQFPPSLLVVKGWPAASRLRVFTVKCSRILQPHLQRPTNAEMH